jgi:hypothetical protein
VPGYSEQPLLEAKKNAPGVLKKKHLTLVLRRSSFFHNLRGVVP